MLDRARALVRRGRALATRWLSNTGNLLHASALLFVPLLVVLVTLLSNAFRGFSFLLFPPLAAGAYTLFADPEGRYASPTRFVLGLTAGAVCGTVADAVAAALLPATSAAGVNPLGAGLAVLAAGATTWLLDVEEPAAFSTALLALVIERATAVEYVVGVAVSSLVVAVVFYAWREGVYERRAEVLYGTVRSDDQVLVPLRPDDPPAVAFLGGRLAAAHGDVGRLVLLDVVEDEADAEGAADRLRRVAGRVSDAVGVDADVVVARGERGAAVVRTAREANCDLVVVPYADGEALRSGPVRTLFDSSVDAVAVRATGDRTAWRRVLVMVARPGDSAHAMLDFAGRLAGADGTVSVTTCIDAESERRPAESRLANLVETAPLVAETRVARSPVEAFVAANADGYDLVFLGSSGDRSAVSRTLSRPTAEALSSVDCDVAVVDRGTV